MNDAENSKKAYRCKKYDPNLKTNNLTEVKDKCIGGGGVSDFKLFPTENQPEKV